MAFFVTVLQGLLDMNPFCAYGQRMGPWIIYVEYPEEVIVISYFALAYFLHWIMSQCFRQLPWHDGCMIYNDMSCLLPMSIAIFLSFSCLLNVLAGFYGGQDVSSYPAYWLLLATRSICKWWLLIVSSLVLSFTE